MNGVYFMKKILSIIMAIAILCGMCAVTVGAEYGEDICWEYISVISEMGSDLEEFEHIDSYIYDIDKNGTPELIINDQKSPSVSEIYIFTYEQNRLVDVGNYPGGRIMLHPYEGRGFLVSYTMDGYGTIKYLYMKDNEIHFSHGWEVNGFEDLESYGKLELLTTVDYASVKKAIIKQSKLNNNYNNISVAVTLNDEEIVFDQPPILQNDRTLVPMRAIFEAMACDVYWDGENQAVDVWRDGENVMTLWIGENEMWTPNGTIELDVPPQVINDHTLVPVRAISESMGAKVFWRGSENMVQICYYPPYSGTTPNEYYYRNQNDIVNFGCFLNDNPHLAGNFGYSFYNYTYDSESDIELCLAEYFSAMENEGYSVEYVKNEHGGDFYQIVGNGYEIDVVNDYLLEHIEIRIFE